MNNYGDCFKYDYEVFPPRKKKAMEWFKKSAETGYFSGMNNYGFSLVNSFYGFSPRKKEAMT
jgi:TPR repeat protein